MRNEQEVFAALRTLCRSSGYVHALAYLSFRDNIVRYSGKMSPSDMASMFSADRLIRTEISTLIGLLIQGEIDWTLPSAHAIQEYIDRTDALLKELHMTFLPAMPDAIAQAAQGHISGSELLGRGEFLRESIFYAGESAYSFQYRDLAPAKYAADDSWFKANRGFSIFDAKTVTQALVRLWEKKLGDTLSRLMTLAPEQWSILPAFTGSVAEVATACGLAELTVEAVLKAFSLSPNERNEAFQAVDDFNVANATPLLRFNGDFVLFQYYSLVEALYESPFYWMASDKPYSATAMQNRGRFTESICCERLASVFGETRVHKNVNIFDSKGHTVGEIDVLVLFGDRAVIVQAKSKRLTLEARKGDDRLLRDDFKKSVQNSYDQGLICAESLTNRAFRFVGPDGKTIVLPDRLSEIYILCVVADHYPALHFQCRQFLKYSRTEVIQAPMVLDVFTVDAIAEMLCSPLQFLSYINRRVGYTERLMASHEIIILSHHLKNNLWLDEANMLWLGDDISVDLDIAMAVRRDGLNGKRTPDGILTRLESTAAGKIVSAIETRPEAGAIDFGFLLLSMSRKAAIDTSNGIDEAARLARLDGEPHDLSMGLDSPQRGFTVHCNSEPLSEARTRLRRHCELRKYREKAGTWLGICVDPKNQSIRFGLKLQYEWKQDERLERLAQTRLTPTTRGITTSRSAKRSKLGRNDPCPCDSGRKYKKCHGS